MTTAHSNEIDSQVLIDQDPVDQDPGSGSEIRDPDPVFMKTGIRIRIRSETDRIRNTAADIKKRIPILVKYCTYITENEASFFLSPLFGKKKTGETSKFDMIRR